MDLRTSGWQDHPGGSFASVNNTPTGNMAVVNAAGALDPTFSLQDGVIIGTGHAVLQADGKVICNARNPYYGLLRIDTSGQVDPTLSRSYGSSEVLFTLDPTGKIVVAGTIFNEPFSERLLNDAGSEVLVPEGGGWKWQRSGSVAAVNQVVFDCFDGVAWSAPVNGTKTSDGWIYSGPVPGRGVLRARGTTIQSKHAGTAQQLVNLGASEGDLVVSLKNGEKVASGLGNNVPFPTVLENHTRDMQFRVSNEGDGILDGIALEISGANASAFRIIGDPARQLAPGDSTVFVIRFNGVGKGETQAEFSITSNDPHKPEHTFVIIGKVGTTLTPTFYSADDVSLVINRFDGSTLYFGSLSLKYPPLPGTVLTVVDSGNTPVQPFSDLPPGSVVTANYDGVTYSFLAGYNGSDNGTDIILSLIGDGTFDQAWGDNGLVGSGPSAVRSGDGQLVVWSNLGGQTKLVRFRVDGTLDPLFNPPPIDIPSPMVIQPDGKVLIGKNRLNWNGSIDQSYVPPQGIVQPLAMLDDGRILVECETASMGSPRILRRLFQDGSIDPTFVDGLPASGSYTDGVELLPDGKMLVFGSSIQLTRLFPDGSVDPTFQSEASAEFVSVQTDGKILVAKRYTGNTKEDSRNFVRLLEDGSVDASYVSQGNSQRPYFDGRVTRAMMQGDGKIVVTGSFTSVNGQPRLRSARLFADGSLDPSFRSDINGSATAIVGNEDGAMIIVGGMTAHSGNPVNYLSKTVPANVASSVISRNGAVIQWLRAGSVPEFRSVIVEKFSPGASSWTFVGSANRISGGWSIESQTIESEATVRMSGETGQGRVDAYVYGQSATPELVLDYRGTIIPNASGVVDIGEGPVELQRTFQVIVANSGGNVLDGISASISGPHAEDFSIEAAPEEKLEPGGQTGIVIKAAPGAVGARSATLTVLSSDPLVPVYSIELRSEGTMDLSPCFSSPGEIPFSATEFTATGKAFGNLSLGFAPASRTVLTVVDLQGTNPISGRLDDLPHGKVIEAEYEGTIYRFLVNYKGGSGNDLVLHLIEPGLIDPTFSADINDGVVAVAIQPDGKVLIGGSFTTIAGRPARRIARLNRDGSHDGTFKAGVNGFVEGVAVQGDGKILVSGAFTEASGEERRGIVRFLPDGRVDPSFQCNAGPIVNRLLILNSGKILIGGRIDEVNGTAVKNLVLLNGDGSMDSSFACNVEATSGTAAVYAMTELSDGNLLIGGTFSRVGGISGVLKPFLAICCLYR
jgi:uncharacterized delta-60 repeat protein